MTVEKCLPLEKTIEFESPLELRTTKNTANITIGIADSIHKYAKGMGIYPQTRIYNTPFFEKVV